MTSTPRHRSVGQIFLIPAIMALFVAFGLVSALLGDGIWDALSWFCLLVPVVAVAYYVGWQRSRRRTV
jgi:glucose-6-phosphate-specific signal transduction histidine kinase